MQSYDFRRFANQDVTVTTRGAVVTFSIGAARVHTRIVGQNLRIEDSDAPESLRGQGLGKAMYRAVFLEAQKRGLGVQSDLTVEEPAARVWQSLKREGFPIHMHPQAETIDVDGVLGWYVPGVTKPVFWLPRSG